MKKFLYQDLYDLEEKHWWHIVKRETCRKLLSNYFFEKSPKILDIGCGTGRNLEFLGKIGQVWGIDSSKEAIKLSLQRGMKRVKLRKSDSLDFRKSSFEIVTLLDVLEHIPEKKSLREINRILKPGGLLLFLVPAFPFLWSKWDEILHHKRRYTKKIFQKLMEKNNFLILKISYLYSFLLIPVFIIRKIKSFLFSKNYSSDFKLSTHFLNRLLLFLARIEASLMIKGIPIPFGTSLICLARKKKEVKDIFLSAIIPVFNEASRIDLPLKIKLVANHLKSRKFSTELIIINDGSTDSTLSKLKENQKKNKFRIISYSKNKGKGHAVKTGMLAAKGEYRLFLDMDLSVSIEEIEKIIPYLKKDRIIIGTRKAKGSKLVVRQPKIRETLGQCFTLLSKLVLRVKVSDFTCGFKCFSAEAAEKIFSKALIKRWGFDSEILFLATKAGLTIKEIPVVWKNDPKTRVKFPKDIITSLTDLAKIRLNNFLGKY